MIEKITFCAEKSLIERAHRRAESEHTTLEAAFRRWLVRYVERPKIKAEFEALMERLDYVRSGKRFNRGGMNDR